MSQLDSENAKKSSGCKGHKATNQEVERRIQEIADYLLRWPLASDFEIHDKFCPEFELKWRQVSEYTARAKQLNRKRLSMKPDEMRQLGQAVLMDLLKSPNEKIRVQAERSLREIAGYGAPPRIPEDAEGKPMQFVPLTIDPKQVTGE